MNREPHHSNVLILGAGFAGVACARRLERLLPRQRTLVLVNRDNYSVFQPLLPEVVGGSLAPSHVVGPLRHMLSRTNVVRGEVEQITLGSGDVAGRVRVRLAGTEQASEFTAAHLVLALGSVVDVSRIPGMAEHAMLMKNVADALALRHTIVARLERAASTPAGPERRTLGTFVVVGGGFSGVETAAEINDLLRTARRFFPALADEPLRVICVHSRERILPELPERLGEHALRHLRRRGVEFVLGARTRAVSGEGVYLEGGDTIQARTVVCTVGNAPHPMLHGLGEQKEGRLVVDAQLRLLGRPNVWAIGDGARVPDGLGGISPPTAQYATRQGDIAGRNIAAALAGRPLVEFRHRDLGQLATLGHRSAVAAIGRLRITGFVAWWLWRSIYLLKLPRLDRKLRVVIDWTMNLFFPRDLISIDPAGTTGPPAIHLEGGETLFRQGDPSAAFYVVASGAIELTRCDDGGGVLAKDELLPGDHFGEGSLLHKGTRTTTAVALRPSTVLRFPAANLLAVAQSFRGLRHLLEASSRRFQPSAALLPPWVGRQDLDRPLREIMTAPVFTLPADATLRTGLHEFLRRGHNAFPLVRADGRLAGLVTRTDLFAALRRDAELERPLLAIGTDKVRCLPADDKVSAAVELMRRHDIKHVVVVDGQQRPAGIVSVKDVLRLIANAPAAGVDGNGQPCPDAAPSGSTETRNDRPRPDS